MKLSEKIQEALREQQEINLSDPAVQKRLAAQWGYVPAGAQLAPSVSSELLDRTIDTIGRFCSDEGWMQSDMDTLDALIAASEAKPAPSVPADTLEIIRGLVREVERKTCAHEETHRGGFVWEICDSCGAKWADDEGGKPEFVWPEVVEKAREFLAAAPEAKPWPFF